MSEHVLDGIALTLEDAKLIVDGIVPFWLKVECSDKLEALGLLYERNPSPRFDDSAMVSPMPEDGE